MASAPGELQPGDVPLLKLEVVEHHGECRLMPTTTILRLNTKGGGLSGPCAIAGDAASTALLGGLSVFALKENLELSSVRTAGRAQTPPPWGTNCYSLVKSPHTNRLLWRSSFSEL